MNKKLLSILALIAMLGLAACGADVEEDDTTVTPDNQVEVETPNEDETPEFNGVEEDSVVEGDESEEEQPIIEDYEFEEEDSVVEDEE